MTRLHATALCALMASPALAQQASLDLVGPISDYKLYVTENTDKLVSDTAAFAGAIKGDVPDHA